MGAPSILNGGLGGISLAYWVGILGLAVYVESKSIDMQLNTGSRSADYLPGMIGFDPRICSRRGNPPCSCCKRNAYFLQADLVPFLIVHLHLRFKRHGMSVHPVSREVLLRF